MKTRKAEPIRSKGPASPAEWEKVMRQLIDRLARLKKPHEGLKAAYVQGNSEQMLRRMSILSQTDIDREYPDQM